MRKSIKRISSLDRAIAEVKAVREADEREEKRKEMDVWFQNLTILQRCDMALSLWCNLSLKDKEKQYELKKNMVL